MDRKQTISALYDIAQVFVKEMDLTEMKTSDASCGIWDAGEYKMSDMLRREYGEMKEITFHNGISHDTEYSHNWEKSVVLRFRFANPVLCIHKYAPDGEEIMGSIELSDHVWEGPELVHNGEYHISEMMSWGLEGYEITGRLIEMWKQAAQI